MDNKNFTLTFTVSQSPKEVFEAVKNVRQWWSEEIEGNAVALNDEFSYHFEDVHRCQLKLIELIADKKVVWLVKDNYFNFTKDATEWVNTKLIFEISQKSDKTEVHFTHEGLVPEYECYEACTAGWTQYAKHSLKSLITTGKGQPNATGRPKTTHEENLRVAK